MAKVSIAQTFTVNDTAFLFNTDQYQRVKILAVNGKTASVLIDGKPQSVKTKNLYSPYQEPHAIKCRHFDNVLTADVIVDGSALGFNKKYILVEFCYNRETMIAVKHESDMVKSLNKKQ